MNQDRATDNSILEIQVEAMFAGHDLLPFESVTDRITGGYETRCKRCGRTAWVGENGLQYSLLGYQCEPIHKTSLYS